jgi:hypothetical protein
LAGGWQGSRWLMEGQTPSCLLDAVHAQTSGVQRSASPPLHHRAFMSRADQPHATQLSVSRGHLPRATFVCLKVPRHHTGHSRSCEMLRYLVFERPSVSSASSPMTPQNTRRRKTRLDRLTVRENPQVTTALERHARTCIANRAYPKTSMSTLLPRRARALRKVA